MRITYVEDISTDNMGVDKRTGDLPDGKMYHVRLGKVGSPLSNGES